MLVRDHLRYPIAQMSLILVGERHSPVKGTLQLNPPGLIHTELTHRLPACHQGSGKD